MTRTLGAPAILVNNAGITRDATLHNMTPEQWSAVINTNLGSMFNMCRNVIEGMRERKFGRIINISSINGQKRQFGQTNYSAAIAGILRFTKALGLEEASKGITVNAVVPGYCVQRLLLRCRKTSCGRLPPAFPSAGSANPRILRGPSRSWRTTMQTSTPARRSRSMAASLRAEIYRPADALFLDERCKLSEN